MFLMQCVEMTFSFVLWDLRGFCKKKEEESREVFVWWQKKMTNELIIILEYGTHVYVSSTLPN